VAKLLIGSGCHLGWSGIGVVDGGHDRQRGRAVLGVNFGCPIVTNGDFVA